MKWLLFKVLFLAGVAMLVNACESTDTTGDSPIKTSATVPGEKSADEPISATAGPGGARAGVPW